VAVRMRMLTGFVDVFVLLCSVRCSQTPIAIKAPAATCWTVLGSRTQNAMAARAEERRRREEARAARASGVGQDEAQGDAAAGQTDQATGGGKISAVVHRQRSRAPGSRGGDQTLQLNDLQWAGEGLRVRLRQDPRDAGAMAPARVAKVGCCGHDKTMAQERQTMPTAIRNSRVAISVNEFPAAAGNYDQILTSEANQAIRRLPSRRCIGNAPPAI
jgi:hypothetical protein